MNETPEMSKPSTVEPSPRRVQESNEGLISGYGEIEVNQRQLSRAQAQQQKQISTDVKRSPSAAMEPLKTQENPLHTDLSQNARNSSQGNKTEVGGRVLSAANDFQAPTPCKVSEKSSMSMNMSAQKSLRTGMGARQLKSVKQKKRHMIHGIKKFIMKDSAIKKVVADHKACDQVIAKVEALSTLATPTKKRVRNFMTMHQTDTGNPDPSHSEPIDIGDAENPDLIFVVKGMIKVIFINRQPLSDDNQQPTVRLLKAKEYLDYLNKEKDLVVQSITTQGSPCVFISMPFRSYKKYANCPLRQHDDIFLRMLKVLPQISEVSKQKKAHILNLFQEVEYCAGVNGNRKATILEKEGDIPEYIYWILSGEICMFRKVAGLYAEKSKQEMDELRYVDAPLENISNPKEGGNMNLGVNVGRLTGPDNLVAEFGGLKNSVLKYSLVTGQNLLVWRFPADAARNIWPPETQRLLLMSAQEKYGRILDNIIKLESRLLDTPYNQIKIERAVQVQERAKANYPMANLQARNKLKEANLNLLQRNEHQYLAVQKRNDTYKQMPLTGNGDKNLDVRLKKVLDVCFTGWTEHQYYRSDKLNVIKEREQKQRDLEKVAEDERKRQEWLTNQHLTLVQMDATINTSQSKERQQRQKVRPAQSLLGHQIRMATKRIHPGSAAELAYLSSRDSKDLLGTLGSTHGLSTRVPGSISCDRDLKYNYNSVIQAPDNNSIVGQDAAEILPRTRNEIFNLRQSGGGYILMQTNSSQGNDSRRSKNASQQDNFIIDAGNIGHGSNRDLSTVLFSHGRSSTEAYGQTSGRPKITSASQGKGLKPDGSARQSYPRTAFKPQNVNALPRFKYAQQAAQFGAKSLDLSSSADKRTTRYSKAGDALEDSYPNNYSSHEQIDSQNIAALTPSISQALATTKKLPGISKVTYEDGVQGHSYYQDGGVGRVLVQRAKSTQGVQQRIPLRVNQITNAHRKSLNQSVKQSQQQLDQRISYLQNEDPAIVALRESRSTEQRYLLDKIQSDKEGPNNTTIQETAGNNQLIIKRPESHANPSRHPYQISVANSRPVKATQDNCAIRMSSPTNTYSSPYVDLSMRKSAPLRQMVGAQKSSLNKRDEKAKSFYKGPLNQKDRFAATKGSSTQVFQHLSRTVPQKPGRLLKSALKVERPTKIQHVIDYNNYFGSTITSLQNRCKNQQQQKTQKSRAPWAEPAMMAISTIKVNKSTGNSAMISTKLREVSGKQQYYRNEDYNPQMELNNKRDQLEVKFAKESQELLEYNSNGLISQHSMTSLKGSRLEEGPKNNQIQNVLSKKSLNTVYSKDVQSVAIPGTMTMHRKTEYEKSEDQDTVINNLTSNRRIEHRDLTQQSSKELLDDMHIQPSRLQDEPNIPIDRQFVNKSRERSLQTQEIMVNVVHRTVPPDGSTVIALEDDGQHNTMEIHSSLPKEPALDSVILSIEEQE